MILGPGWAFLGLLAIGLVAVVLLPGCGIVVVDAAPSGDLRLYAPRLVDADSTVEARAASVANLSLARAKRQVRGGALRIRTTGCHDIPTGSGFALDPKLLIASEDVLPGASALRVSARTRRARTVGATRVYRLGEFGIARVDGRLPRTLPYARSAALGSSVAVIAYPLSAPPRLLRGVVVDEVAGARFGLRGHVLLLTSTLEKNEPGGPVIDAKGRVVAVALGPDRRTGLTVAVPISTIRSLLAKHALEALPACDGP